MLVDEIKKRVLVAMKANDAVTKDILRLALGEMQTAEARAERSLSEEEAVAVVRKLVKSNEETLSIAEEMHQKETLKKELSVLCSLLPTSLTVAQIVDLLDAVRDPVREAKSDGQATGVAMKHIKSAGANVDGRDVAQAVKQIRS